jgi:hypothetical protein
VRVFVAAWGMVYGDIRREMGVEAYKRRQRDGLYVWKKKKQDKHNG